MRTAGWKAENVGQLSNKHTRDGAQFLGGLLASNANRLHQRHDWRPNLNALPVHTPVPISSDPLAPLHRS